MVADSGGADWYDDVVPKMRDAFPDLFFEGTRDEHMLHIDMETGEGVRERVRVAYPVDVDRAYEAARRLLDDEARRDKVADVLVSALGGYESPTIGNAAHILRWLVLSQRVLVTFGDQEAVDPILSSPSIALLHDQAHQLKVWADGAAVLHVDTPDAESASQDSCGLDLARTSLREIQARWFGTWHDDLQPPTGQSSGQLAAQGFTAVARGLLADYDGGSWLSHHRFASTVLSEDSEYFDWEAANRLSTLSTEATLQDRAVLAVACHLSGEVTPDISLHEALHFVGSGRDVVLEALGSVAGGHPDPHEGWSTECPTCP